MLIPHILIGSIIGKGGSRIREIQEASGARLNASDACLPLSTERSLVILGVADAVHIATYYVAVTLVEQLTERFGGPAASAYATRSGGPAGAVPGGMQVVPYVPQPAGGQYGHPDTFKRHHPHPNRAQSGAYGVPYMHGQPAPTPVGQAPMPYGAPTPHTPYAAATPHQPTPYVGGPQPTPGRGPPTAPAPVGGAMPGQPLTQQIYIPNDMVGAIIGKGGAKINEIRHLSGSVIKINEPQESSNERLVTITGTQECNQMALYMLYSRLGSSCNKRPSICFILTRLQKAKSIASRPPHSYAGAPACVEPKKSTVVYDTSILLDFRRWCSFLFFLSCCTLFEACKPLPPNNQSHDSIPLPLSPFPRSPDPNLS